MYFISKFSSNDILLFPLTPCLPDQCRIDVSPLFGAAAIKEDYRNFDLTRATTLQNRLITCFKDLAAKNLPLIIGVFKKNISDDGLIEVSIHEAQELQNKINPQEDEVHYYCIGSIEQFYFDYLFSINSSFETPFSNEQNKKYLHLLLSANKGDAQAQLLLGDEFKKLKQDTIAFNYYSLAEQSGSNRALLKVAECYLYGEGVPQNLDMGYKFCRIAAESGSGEAIHRLGIYTFLGIGTDRDILQGMKYFKNAARAHNGQAAYKFAHILRTCFKEIPVDWKVLYHYYHIAAKNGVVEAMPLVAFCHLFGCGAVKDINLAFDWCQKGATATCLELDFVHAECYLQAGLGYFKNKFEAIQLLLKLAEKKCILAIVSLAQRYSRGQVFPISPIKAFHYYRTAAQLGSLHAMSCLAKCHLEGFGTSVNPHEAFKWTLKAAQCKHPLSMLNLAKCYLNGWGVKGNISEAITCFKNAVALGEKVGLLYLAHIYENSSDYKEALTYHYNAARELHNPISLYFMGKHYKRAPYIENHLRRAFMYWEKAAERGHAPSQFRLYLCFVNGDGVFRNAITALTWLKKSAEQGFIPAQFVLGIHYYKYTQKQTAIPIFQKILKDKNSLIRLCEDAIPMNILDGFIHDAEKSLQGHEIATTLLQLGEFAK